MVKTLFFLMFFSFNLMAQNVIVRSEMNYTDLFAGNPLTGTVTITHDKTENIDLKSFKVGSKPLDVKFLNDITISDTSPLIISIYSFEIPPMPKGLHVFPQVSVEVGGKIYKSYSTSFEVRGSQGVVNQPPSNQPSRQVAPEVKGPARIENSSLILETKVDVPKKLYPGQEITATYRFIYQGHIELTQETLPLLDYPGLKKIGDKINNSYMDNAFNVSEFSQKYVVENPGIFPSGPSMIEGRAYEEMPGGKKVYATEPLRSENNPVVVEVLPFPINDKPASFNGAIGKYTFKVALKGSNVFTPGEKILLLVEITGNPEYLSTVQAPDLCCQPGFSGNFKPSDLPPVTTIIGNSKQFLVDLTPLSSTITEIPPIEFSSFDPVNRQYLIEKSLPIPLTFKAVADSGTVKTDEEIPLDTTLKNPSPIEISNLFPLTKSDLYDSFLGTFWNLLFIPVFAILLITQSHLQKDVLAEPVSKEIPSQELLKTALEQEAGSTDFYKLLQKALLTALKEQGEIESIEIEPENLEKTGLAGDLRVFLKRLEEVRFSGSKSYNLSIISSAKELYQKITGTAFS